MHGSPNLVNGVCELADCELDRRVSDLAVAEDERGGLGSRVSIQAVLTG